ncbi:MAG TPA: hypothetical protein VID04_14290 [Methylomirabilota bacterium]
MLVLGRFMPMLILCCVLDLFVPVAPTPAGGVEFEEDEEVVHLASWRPARPASSPRVRDQHQARLTRERLAAPPAVVRMALEASPTAPRAHLAAADPSPAPPASGEDH